MTFASNLTDLDVTIDSLPASLAQQHDAKLFARSIASRGFCQVDVLCSHDVVYLVFATASVLITYRAEPDGERHVRAVTRFENGHDGAFDLPVRAYGLVASMLLAGE